MCHHSSIISSTDQSQSREWPVPTVALTERLWCTLQPSRERLAMPSVALSLSNQCTVTLARWLIVDHRLVGASLSFVLTRNVHTPTGRFRRTQRTSSVLEAALPPLLPRNLVLAKINGEWHTTHVHNWTSACLYYSLKFAQAINCSEVSTESAVCITRECLRCLLPVTMNDTAMPKVGQLRFPLLCWRWCFVDWTALDTRKLILSGTLLA